MKFAIEYRGDERRRVVTVDGDQEDLFFSPGDLVKFGEALKFYDNGVFTVAFENAHYTWQLAGHVPDSGLWKAKMI